MTPAIGGIGHSFPLEHIFVARALDRAGCFTETAVHPQWRCTATVASAYALDNFCCLAAATIVACSSSLSPHPCLLLSPTFDPASLFVQLSSLTLDVHASLCAVCLSGPLDCFRLCVAPLELQSCGGCSTPPSGVHAHTRDAAARRWHLFLSFLTESALCTLTPPPSLPYFSSSYPFSCS